ncbi:CHC2 zinc finger domain-containing protein [Desulfobacterales bacterium HSG17]|nr:CHC2 zinc finger domain-containing protein [Desulfobacterales bacterium HSG17]
MDSYRQKKRFSDKELFELRNFFPIAVLIEQRLLIPSKISEGYFRFLCPLCSEFQTSTNPTTNLARCFRCEKNFNTIDLVMICRKIGFVESVKYLQKIKPINENNQAQTHLLNHKPMLLKDIFKHLANAN